MTPLNQPMVFSRTSPVKLICALILTDVVILSARPELEAQRERCEELELLGELERAVGRVRPVALPALEAFGRVVTRAVAVVVDHVEHIALGSLLRDRVLIVRTVHIQVVIYTDVDVIVSTVKPAGHKESQMHQKTILRFMHPKDCSIPERNVWQITHANICLIFHSDRNRRLKPLLCFEMNALLS